MAKSLTQLSQQNTRTTVGNRLLLRRLTNGINITFVTLLTTAVLAIYLAPFLFMIFTSLKTTNQIAALGAPIWPAKPETYTYKGADIDVYKVPLATCAGQNPNDKTLKNLAAVKKGRQETLFVDRSEEHTSELQ